MAEYSDWPGWEDEDRYWRTNYSSRPYVSTGTRDYDYYRPGYQYGYESAKRYHGKNWNDVESHLSNSWNSFEHGASRTWEQMKDAVRDAWDRVTGHRTVGSRY